MGRKWSSPASVEEERGVPSEEKNASVCEFRAAF